MANYYQVTGKAGSDVTGKSGLDVTGKSGSYVTGSDVNDMSAVSDVRGRSEVEFGLGSEVTSGFW